MKARFPSFEMRDVGDLQAVRALCTESRTRRGIKTPCAACGKQITDEFFFAGFAQGQPNRMFHFDCLDDISQAIAKYPDCQVCRLECRAGTGHMLNGYYIHNACEAMKAEV